MRALLVACLPAALLAGCGPMPDTAEACKTTELARLALVPGLPMPVVDVTIGGKPARMLVDTGAERTVVTEASFGKLGLERDYTVVGTSTGLGASSMYWPSKPVELKFGPLDRPASGVSVIAMPGFRFDGLLGSAVLSDYDVDMDIPAGRMTLYAPRNCPHGPPPFADAAGTVATFRIRAFKMGVPILVDGTPVQAEVDTGATNTLVDRQAAGLSEAQLAADRSINTRTADPQGLSVQRHRFASLRVGGIEVERPFLNVGAMRTQGYAALLGDDLWRRRRLWLSYAGQSITIGPDQPRPR